MLRDNKAFSGFAVPDLDEARRFYGETLGVDVEPAGEGAPIMTLHLAGGRDTIVYAKPDHVPATFTILNFEVDDIDAAVDELTQRGVELERYEGFEQDERGIMRGRERGLGPDIAWFKDPGGNILSVLQEN